MPRPSDRILLDRGSATGSRQHRQREPRRTAVATGTTSFSVLEEARTEPKDRFLSTTTSSTTFTAHEPNQVWLTDITEHLTDEGKLYLCAIEDWHSTKKVGYTRQSAGSGPMSGNGSARFSTGTEIRRTLLTEAIEVLRLDTGVGDYAGPTTTEQPVIACLRLWPGACARPGQVPPDRRCAGSPYRTPSP